MHPSEAQKGLSELGRPSRDLREYEKASGIIQILQGTSKGLCKTLEVLGRLKRALGKKALGKMDEQTDGQIDG